MTDFITYAATHTHFIMGVCVVLYLWIALGNFIMHQGWLAGMWVAYAFANVFLIGDWIKKMGNAL